MISFLRSDMSKSPVAASGPGLKAAWAALCGLVLAGLVWFLGEGTARAGSTKHRVQVTAKDFAKGKAVTTSILPEGTVVPGFRADHVSVEGDFVWTSAPSVDGRLAFFGTGNPGALFAVDLEVKPRGNP